MSYDDENRGGGYGGDQAGSSGAQNTGYRRTGGEADEYFNESDRPSGGHSGGQRPDDDRRGDYGGQGGGRRYDDDNRGESYGGQHGSGRYDAENDGGGHGGSAASYGSGGGHHGGSSGYDQDEAIKQARKHGNEDDGNLFSQAMSFLGNKEDDDDDIDEQQVVGAHQQLYGNHSSDGAHDSKSLGAGAAMQALKMFTGGGAGAGGMGSQGAGNSQSQFIGMAMAQAGKLFDQQNGQGNVASGADKQSAVNAAAKMALKMYMKSEGQGGGGGQGGLLGMASKFM
jgi:hypothetical protein